MPKRFNRVEARKAAHLHHGYPAIGDLIDKGKAQMAIIARASFIEGAEWQSEHETVFESIRDLHRIVRTCKRDYYHNSDCPKCEYRCSQDNQLYPCDTEMEIRRLKNG